MLPRYINVRASDDTFHDFQYLTYLVLLLHHWEIENLACLLNIEKKNHKHTQKKKKKKKKKKTHQQIERNSLKNSLWVMSYDISVISYSIEFFLIFFFF